MQLTAAGAATGNCVRGCFVVIHVYIYTLCRVVVFISVLCCVFDSVMHGVLKNATRDFATCCFSILSQNS